MVFNFVGLGWVCVLCGWATELVLQLGRVFHRIRVWFPDKLLWICSCCFSSTKLGYCYKFFIKPYTSKFDMHIFCAYPPCFENWKLTYTKLTKYFFILKRVSRPIYTCKWTWESEWLWTHLLIWESEWEITS